MPWLTATYRSASTRRATLRLHLQSGELSIKKDRARHRGDAHSARVAEDQGQPHQGRAAARDQPPGTPLQDQGLQGRSLTVPASRVPSSSAPADASAPAALTATDSRCARELLRDLACSGARDGVVRVLCRGKLALAMWANPTSSAGVAAAVCGVALNEVGVTTGRFLIMAGLPAAAVGAFGGLMRPGPEPVVAVDVRPHAEAMVLRTAGRLGFGSPTDARAGCPQREGDRALARPTRHRGVCVRARHPRARHGAEHHAGTPTAGDARKEVQSGDSGFDSLYCVRADEHARGVHVLTGVFARSSCTRTPSLDDTGRRCWCRPRTRSRWWPR